MLVALENDIEIEIEIQIELHSKSKSADELIALTMTFGSAAIERVVQRQLRMTASQSIGLFRVASH